MIEEEMRLFCYGTLRIPEIQQQVFGRTLEGKNDFLEGYARENKLGEDDVYSKASASPGHEIDGSLYSVTKEDLAKADAYEGTGYTRMLLPLKSGLTAWVYIANS